MTLAQIPTHVLSVLLHATGANRCVNRPDLEVGWRNRYCCGPSHEGWDSCREAVTLGLMGVEPDAEWIGEDTLYYAAAAGLDAARVWVADRQRGRVWRVVVDENGRAHNTYCVADTRSKARAMQIRSLREAWNCTWREALNAIVSVQRHR
jgi:hypothetical protein